MSCKAHKAPLAELGECASTIKDATMEGPMTFHRIWIKAAIIFGSITIATGSATAQKRYAPGVNDTEIKIGQTMPYSGPASAWGTIGRAELAYIKMINDQGGINGRKINLISLDDAYSPPKTVEQTRKLVEQEGVAFVFGGLGTAANLAVRKYLNDRQVPQLFLLSGSGQFDVQSIFRGQSASSQPIYWMDRRMPDTSLRTDLMPRLPYSIRTTTMGRRM
jgi:branched-chain amino acid transport system substrate-binding protein